MIIYSEPKTSPGLTFQKTVAITSARRVYTGPKVSGCHPVLVTFENYADRSPNNSNTGDSAGAYCVRNLCGQVMLSCRIRQGLDIIDHHLEANYEESPVKKITF